MNMDSASPTNGGSVAVRTSRARSAASTNPVGRNATAESGNPAGSRSAWRVPQHPLAPGDGRA